MPGRKLVRALHWVFAALAVAWLVMGALGLWIMTKPARAAEACPTVVWPKLGAPIVKLQPGDLRALAGVGWGEARGEGFCAMLAVQAVVINRVRTAPKTFGATVSQVLGKPNQFSIFGKRDPNRAKVAGLDERDPLFLAATLAALAALSGVDPTSGAVYFHHRDMVPDWASRTVVSARIGSHVFRKAK